ncbi:hypothetical protein [Streptomyces sp. 6N223]|uniref:hypothetical protein n=1 Tax=Streptomyces sp. 6N223 TaxID=3457412 RepID=UPI003FD4983D
MMTEPEPRHDYATLTASQVARIAAEIRPTVEALLRVHGYLRRDEPLCIVDGRLAMPEGTPEDLLAWPVDYLIKAAADRLLAENACEDQTAADAGGARC